MSSLFVLRPEPGASETAERARERGLDAKSIPLFRIEPIAWKVPDSGSFDALILTSANAIRSAGDQLQSLRGLPVHAVGKATADAARDAGFDIATSGDAGVERLLGSLEADLELLHLCGENRTEIDEARQKITAIPVYRSAAIEPGPNLREAEGGIVLVHSARAGKRLSELARTQGLDLDRMTLAAISASAAEAAGSGWKAVEVADQPSDDALLALVERLCDNQPQG